MKQCPLKAAAKASGKTTYSNGRPCSKGHVADRLVATGGCSQCARECRMRSYHENDHRGLTREYARKRRAKDPSAERQRAVRLGLKSKYGLTETGYANLFALQNGNCAICKTPMISRLDESRPLYSGRGAPLRALARVDHCHKTEVVRGLLCGECNIGLGKFLDNETNLLSAVRYLRASRATAQRDDRVQPETLQGENEPQLMRDLSRTVCRVSRRDELSPF